MNNTKREILFKYSRKNSKQFPSFTFLHFPQFQSSQNLRTPCFELMNKIFMTSGRKICSFCRSIIITGATSNNGSSYIGQQARNSLSGDERHLPASVRRMIQILRLKESTRRQGVSITITTQLGASLVQATWFRMTITTNPLPVSLHSLTLSLSLSLSVSISQADIRLPGHTCHVNITQMLLFNNVP